MEWPDKKPAGLDADEKRTLGKGVFRLCEGCSATLTCETLEANFQVCALCNHHHKLGAKGFRSLLLDGALLDAWDHDLAPADPLGFEDGKSYISRIAASQKATGFKDAIEIGRATMHGRAIAYGSFLFNFMGGSMGSVVGEKIARLFEYGARDNLPVVLLQASGGARMQEGILSLMQMAKTVVARERLRAARVPFVSVLLHPTTGGVAASFAFLGDVNIAEPNALIGFAGPRVIETTIRQTLPAGFQRSEFLLAHGMVDRVTPRAAMKDEIVRILSHLTQTKSPLPSVMQLASIDTDDDDDSVDPFAPRGFGGDIGSTPPSSLEGRPTDPGTQQ
jgi:acetyl-CoA carboxylase carboxyl transferase subunit beta